jgi:sulfur-oxidizing protein SoxA
LRTTFFGFPPRFSADAENAGGDARATGNDLKDARPTRSIHALARALVVALSVLTVTVMAEAADIPDAERRSGLSFMGTALRAMQEDDSSNPASLWLLEGETLWDRKVGESGKSCADCHGKAALAMKGVAAHYPAIDPASSRPMDLEQRINLCRTVQQKAPALAFESRELLALTALVARQSRGLPIGIADSPASRPFIDLGSALFHRRQGQLDLSCAQCHDDNWGKHLGGAVIPQGHPTGYPIYRLEWQTLGSLQRRLRGCMAGMRAEPYAYGSAEAVELELYLMWRARGMPLETPAVRP